MRIRDAGLLAAFLAVTAPLPPAYGTFTTTPVPPAMSMATATLSAPASASAVNSACVVAVSRIVSVSWAETSSGFADGYVVRRATASAGPYATVATIGVRTVTTWEDTTVAASTTYFYRVQATKFAWRSGDSPTASISTPSLVCVL